jgi:alpha-mannosidase
MFTDHTTSYSYGEDEPLALTVQYSGNGLWWRNYPIDGPSEIDYALMPHPGRWDNAHLQQIADDWHNPINVSHSHTVPQPTRSLLSATCQLSAAITQPDGSLLLRLFSADGTTGYEKVKMKFPVADVEEVDLNGNTISRLIPDAKGVVTLKMPRFAIKTLKVKPIN